MTIKTLWNDTYREWWAWDDDTYDGAEDSNQRQLGRGSTPDEAVADLMAQLDGERDE